MKHENAQKISPNSSARAIKICRRNFALGKVRRKKCRVFGHFALRFQRKTGDLALSLVHYAIFRVFRGRMLGHPIMPKAKSQIVGLKNAPFCCKSEQLEWRHLFYRGAPKSSENKKNILRTFPLVRNFPLKVAANFLEHSFGAFIEKVSPFMPT